MIIFDQFLSSDALHLWNILLVGCKYSRVIWIPWSQIRILQFPETIEFMRFLVLNLEPELLILNPVLKTLVVVMLQCLFLLIILPSCLYY